MASRTTSSTQDSTSADAVKSTKAAKSATRKTTVTDIPTAPKAVVETAAPRKKSAPLASGGNAVQLTPEERQRCVSEAAYFIAERRGFPAGSHVEDWLQAESEIDQMLAGTTRH
jgi:hypothetical protein